ncbi:hypothetical protein EBU95_20575, partial [bacterium]|nr:hypothetical protein [bacterium]
QADPLLFAKIITNPISKIHNVMVIMVFPLWFDFHVYAVIGAFEAGDIKKAKNLAGFQIFKLHHSFLLFIQNCVFHKKRI